MMSILVKDDDVSSETRPRLELFTAGYGRHGSQWVKIMQKRLFAKSDYQGDGGGGGDHSPLNMRSIHVKLIVLYQLAS